MSKLQVLKECTVHGNTIKLPNYNLDRKVYLEVKKAFELIGGKWKGGKVFAFVFDENPEPYLKKLIGGDDVNLKKQYQFFATPQELAEKMAYLLEPENHHSILEPSAGQGALIQAVHRITPDVVVDYFELMPINRDKIEAKNILMQKTALGIYPARCIGFNFETFEGTKEAVKKYDRIIANPPFSKGQEIVHIKNMYKTLNRGGRLVSVISNSYNANSTKKYEEFREWLEAVNADIEEIEAGTFKSSGTMVATNLLIINKPI